MNRFPPYRGLEWDRKISSPDDPNFWKYSVANLIFLDCVGDKKLVLDLGCGTGGSSFFLVERGKVELVVGVDLLDDMIRVAEKNAINRGLNRKMSFLVCDGRHLPFKASCFDALISRGDAFCFLVPLKRAVQELKRVLKPKGVIVLEMDNRADWKPGTVISTSFQKITDGRIAYVVEMFTAKRNHRATSYILDPNGEIARDLMRDPEFREKGHKLLECPLQQIKKETLEVRKGVPTHWPKAKELFNLFRKSGFIEVRVMGDGLLMKLLLNGDETIVEAMKRDSQLFFKIEKRLIPYINPDKAPTIVLRARAWKPAPYI
ncbi:MAG: ubiquinone/menaquinone biosynthesis methyltransferase [Candidatus Bathyarchaeota archaeon BA1]|nr:MAG: ubiquinone/menaquinone biosynthesis methyltransferase [Candidatus Bathyarchaeota archaeon BA1]